MVRIEDPDVQELLLDMGFIKPIFHLIAFNKHGAIVTLEGLKGLYDLFGFLKDYDPLQFERIKEEI